MTELTRLSVHEAAALLKKGDITSVELTQAHLDRIAAVDGHVQAFLTVTPDLAMDAARRSDERRRAGEDDPLLGIPIGYKDVLCTQGVETTCGSKMLKGYQPPFSATTVERLAQRGMVMLGKLNMDEFAMGSSTENSAFCTTRNPWDTERVPGGSSGGSAAAVAARMTPVTLGTDTGGSIRQPASLCGVVGLKPSYGRVSRYGLIAFASSLDQIGPFTRTVEDAALILSAMAGHDPLDSTSMKLLPPDFTHSLHENVKGLRIGAPKEYFIEGIEPAIEKAVREAIDLLGQMGAEIREVSLPHSDTALPVYYLVAPAEASANLARFDGIRYGPRTQGEEMWDTYQQTRANFGAEVKRRIMLGTYALSAGYYDAYYLKAQKVRTLIKQDFEQVFAEVDVIACPVSPTTAFKIGERVDDPIQMYLSDIFTIAVNLAGNCGVSVPCGFDQAGLPIGLQLIGPQFGEEKIVQAGYAYQQATDWHTRTPSL